MKRDWFIVAATITCLASSGCQQKDAPEAKPFAERPTASEVFELRSKCAALGEKIKEDNIIGNALTEDQVSKYNPDTNRCYVKLEVSTADLTTPQDKFKRDDYLYDGQTKDLLMFAYWEGDKKTAMIFSDSLQKLVHDPHSYDEVHELLEKFVAEERKP